MIKVFRNDNSEGLSKSMFNEACKRADENYAGLTLRTRKFVIGAGKANVYVTYEDISGL